MTKKRFVFAGTVAGLLLSTLFLYQNCGVVSVSPMAADLEAKACDDAQEYMLFTPVEPAILQLQRYRNNDFQPFEGKDLRWWIDGVPTNVLPAIPVCTRKYDVQVTYLGQCDQEHRQEFQFTDPRCTPGTTTTSTTTTTTTVRAPAPDPGVDVCAQRKANPANVKFQPQGFTEVRKSWGDTFFTLRYGDSINEIFKVPTVYPSFGAVVPVGSYTQATFRRSLGQIIAKQKPMTGKYITTSFVPVDGEAYKLKGIGQQPLYMGNHSQHSMQAYQPDSIYVTISDCPGDFRVATSSVQPVDDHTFSTKCRYEWHNEVGTVRYSTTMVSDGICRLQSGKTYYMNFIFQPKNEVFNPARTTCQFDTPETGIPILRSWGVQGNDETLLRIFNEYKGNCNYNMISEGFTHVN